MKGHDGNYLNLRRIFTMSIKIEGYLKLLREFAPGAVHWTPENMPDMSGKILIVTGGNAGASSGAGCPCD